jgi:hypothetical protein
MTSLVWLLVAWGILTTGLVILLIYRSTLTMHEEDQLFLGESEAHLEREQTELMHRVDRLTPVLRWLGAASAVLIVVIAVIAVYAQMTRPAIE